MADEAIKPNGEASIRVFYPHWENEYGLSEDGTQLLRATRYEFDEEQLRLVNENKVDADESIDCLIMPMEFEVVEPQGAQETALLYHVRAALEILVGIRAPEIPES